eukprot:1155892-Pelagomonas_calceolata.AAC.3
MNTSAAELQQPSAQVGQPGQKSVEGWSPSKLKSLSFFLNSHPPPAPHTSQIGLSGALNGTAPPSQPGA